jgi:peptide/nickel transport system ATP-binding protein
LSVLDEPVLQVHDLRVYYHTPSGSVKAVDGVDFTLRKGERFGLVGESGSGKSTTAWAIMRMIRPPGVIEGGSIRLGDTELRQLSKQDIRGVRLAKIAMVPQGAMNSLNPVMRVGDQILDGMRLHTNGDSKRDMAASLPELLATVGLTPQVLRMYPHELSGGMKQRVCIAIAISLQPKVIIADEPTSALDVVVQRQIMQTLNNVQRRLGASILLVGHDMGLMAKFVDRVGVMYGGKLVEIGDVRDIFTNPKHPYTRLLISSLPSLEEKGRLRGIPGTPPSLLNPPPGCVFSPRCPNSMPICNAVVPVAREAAPNWPVACHLYDEPVDAA